MQNLFALIGTVFVLFCLYLYAGTDHASAASSGVNITPTHLTVTPLR